MYFSFNILSHFLKTKTIIARVGEGFEWCKDQRSLKLEIMNYSAPHPTPLPHVDNKCTLLD